MRRTTLMVLVLAILFAAAAFIAPALQAQAHATHRSAKAAHSSGKTSKSFKTVKTYNHHTARTSASRRPAAAPCVAPSRIGKAVSRTKSHIGSRAQTQSPRQTKTSARRESSDSRTAQAGSHRSLPASVIAAQPQAPASVTHARAARPRALSAPAAPVPAAAAPEPQPVAFRWNRRVTPPPMRGSLASLERQNDRATAEGLERIEDEADLSDRIARGALVPVPASAVLAVNPDLPEHHRYCRPWTARFLADMARAFDAQFRAPLEVSSAVRTVEYQKHLMAINGNAAPAEGDIASPHLTGATIDIAKKGMSRQQIGWMRSFLLPLQAAGKIDVEEEFQQACFHISVYKSYVPARSPRFPQPKGGQSNAEVAGGESALGR